MGDSLTMHSSNDSPIITNGSSSRGNNSFASETSSFSVSHDAFLIKSFPVMELSFDQSSILLCCVDSSLDNDSSLGNNILSLSEDSFQSATYRESLLLRHVLVSHNCVKTFCEESSKSAHSQDGIE